MSGWCLFGDEKREAFERDLKPEYLLDDLRSYQRVFGEEFGLKELLTIEDLRVKALIAEAINNVPEFLLDQIGKARNSYEFPSLVRELERIALVHPREVLKAAFLSNAASILLFHNHPSVSLKPSKEDIALTGRMQQLCMLAGIPVIDHVILGNDQSYFSFREKKILPMEQIQYSVDLNDINLKVAEKEAENYGYEKPHKKSIKESLEENRKKITSGQKTSGVKRKRETTIE